LWDSVLGEGEVGGLQTFDGPTVTVGDDDVEDDEAGGDVEGGDGLGGIDRLRYGGCGRLGGQERGRG
jgi:hypothetical protein